MENESYVFWIPDFMTKVSYLLYTDAKMRQKH